MCIVLAVEVPDPLGTAGVTQLADGLVFDLADTLTGNAEDLTHFFQCVGTAVVHTEAHPQNIGFPLGQGVQNFLQGFAEQCVGGGVSGAGGQSVQERIRAGAERISEACEVGCVCGLYTV